jgi:hypothetical protein
VKRVTGTSEARSLGALVAALFALAVPAAASFPFGSTAPAAEADPATHMTAAIALIDNAPPPLIVMALGTAIVAITVLRRARRSGLGPDADRS